MVSLSGSESVQVFFYRLYMYCLWRSSYPFKRFNLDIFFCIPQIQARTWFSNIKYRGFFYCAQFCRCQACVNDYGQHPNIDYMNCNLTYMTMNAAVTNIWHTPMDVDCVNQTWLHLIKLKFNLCFIWFILCIRHIMERGFFFEVASKGINFSILF